MRLTLSCQMSRHGRSTTGGASRCAKRRAACIVNRLPGKGGDLRCTSPRSCGRTHGRVENVAGWPCMHEMHASDDACSTFLRSV